MWMRHKALFDFACVYASTEIFSFLPFASHVKYGTQMRTSNAEAKQAKAASKCVIKFELNGLNSAFGTNTRRDNMNMNDFRGPGMEWCKSFLKPFCLRFAGISLFLRAIRNALDMNDSRSSLSLLDLFLGRSVGARRTGSDLKLIESGRLCAHERTVTTSLSGFRKLCRNEID